MSVKLAKLAPALSPHRSHLNSSTVADGKSPRRQYRSCDNCRKLRRACDALKPKESPTHITAGRHGSKCTACRKSGRPCTFEWLKHLPQTASRGRHESTRSFAPGSRYHGDTSSPAEPVRLSATSATEHNPLPAQFHPNYLEHVTDSWCAEDSTSRPPQNAGLNLTSLQQEAFKDVVDLSVYDLWTPHFGQSPCRDTEATFQNEDYIVPPELFVEDDFEARDLTDFTMEQSSLASDHAAVFEADDVRLRDEIITDPGHLDLQDGTNMHHFIQSNPWSGGSTTEFFGTNVATARVPSPLLGDGLAMATANQALSNELAQRYHASVENFLTCWLTETNCPYRGGRVSLTHCRGNRAGARTTRTLTYLERIEKLERVSEPLRDTRLTPNQKSAAKKALKLAIMAFGSQWTHRSSQPHQSSRMGSPDGMRDDPLTLHGFERLLQQSLWHEAHRYMNMAAQLDSFHAVFALIVFAIIQQPYSESSELTQMNRFDDMIDATSSNGAKRGRLDHSAAAHPNPPDKGAYRYLEPALHRLVQWKRRLFRWRSVEATPSSRIMYAGSLESRRAAQQMDATFSILWWLGVMCDSTASVLNNQPTVIPDGEFHNSSALPDESTSDERGPNLAASLEPCPSILEVEETMEKGICARAKVDIWDLDMLQDTPCPAPILGMEPLLHEGVAVEVLLWRRLGSLKMLLNRPADQESTERQIKATLQVYEHWQKTYGKSISFYILHHQQLSCQIQSWYVTLAIYFHLACLFTADCVNHLERRSASHESHKRSTSSVMLEMSKASSFVICDLATVSILHRPPLTGEKYFAEETAEFYNVGRPSTMLSEPWRDGFMEALTKAFECMYDWLAIRRSEVEAQDDWNELEWISANTSETELFQRCGICIDALERLGWYSDKGFRIAQTMRSQLHGLVELSPANGALG